MDASNTEKFNVDNDSLIPLFTVMIFTETKFTKAYLIDIERLEDERGFFARSFCEHEFSKHGLPTRFVQSNISYNKKRGILRGLHMQMAPFEEGKLVRCGRGAVYDVIVDLRKHSQTYKQWLGMELSATNGRMIYIPEGFAHGFITLTDDTEVVYQMTRFYEPGSETGYRWNDPALGINWPFDPLIISEKDKYYPLLENA